MIVRGKIDYLHLTVLSCEESILSENTCMKLFFDIINVSVIELGL